MLVGERLALHLSLRDNSLGCGESLGGYDRVAQALLGLLMPIERRVKIFSGGATWSEQPLRLLLELRAQARQRRELRRGGRKRLGKLSARVQQFAAAC